MSFAVELEGYQRFADSIRNVPIARRLDTFLAGVAISLQNEAKMRAPVDRGTLRASIERSSHSTETGGYAEVGIANRLNYAATMEYGAGMIHDHPAWPRVPFVLGPAGVAALDAWSKRKFGADGPSGYAIYVGMQRRGGIAPRRYLRGALEARASDIVSGWQTLIGGLIRSVANGSIE